MAPVSWRDVFDLLETHRRESREEHQAILGELDQRIAPLERDYLLRAGQSQGEQRILGFAKSTLAILISMAAAVGSVIVAILK